MSDGQDYTVETARAAAHRGEIAQWVRGFLASPGSDNEVLAQMLSDKLDCWIGPLRVPLHQLHRLAGPPDAPVLCAVDDDYWDDRVDDMAERVDDGWEPTPVIASYRDGQLVLEDGNHRVEAIRRAGEHDTWALIGFESEDDRDRFTVPKAS